MLLLQLLQLVEEPVVLRVRDLRVVEDVVAVKVMIQLGAELVEPRSDVLQRWSSHRVDASGVA